jgi:bile acid:Na+ symporter, BASS family
MAFPVFSLFDLLLSIVLAFIMLGVGLSLTVSNFKTLFQFPKPLIVGLISQIIVLPVIAFTIAYFSDLSLPLKTGLIILAACPGGTTSGLLTYYFRGNVALSITFTSLNSILTLFTIPFIVNLSLFYFYGQSTQIHLSYIETIIQIFVITIIPASIGVYIRSKNPEFADKIQKPVKVLLSIALACVFIILFFAENKSGGTGITTAEVINILPYALLLNVLCTVWGYFIGVVFKTGKSNAYTIGIEASVHNTTLAFLIAGTLLRDPDMEKPALVYAMFSFWTAVLYSILVKKLSGIDVFSEFKS